MNEQKSSGAVDEKAFESEAESGLSASPEVIIRYELTVGAQRAALLSGSRRARAGEFRYASGSPFAWYWECATGEEMKDTLKEGDFSIYDRVWKMLVQAATEIDKDGNAVITIRTPFEKPLHKDEMIVAFLQELVREKATAATAQ